MTPGILYNTIHHAPFQLWKTLSSGMWHRVVWQKWCPGNRLKINAACAYKKLVNFTSQKTVFTTITAMKTSNLTSSQPCFCILITKVHYDILLHNTKTNSHICIIKYKCTLINLFCLHTDTLNTFSHTVCS